MELRKCGEGGADVAAGDRRSDQVAGGPEVPHERGNDWMGERFSGERGAALPRERRLRCGRLGRRVR